LKQISDACYAYLTSGNKNERLVIPSPSFDLLSQVITHCRCHLDVTKLVIESCCSWDLLSIVRKLPLTCI